MIFRRRQLTDTEFIERLRRQAQANRKWGVFLCVLTGFCLLGYLVFIPYEIHRLLIEASIPAPGGAAGQGLFFGAAMGFMFVVLASTFGQMLSLALGFRIHRLLLKSYDEAAGKAVSGAPSRHESSPVDPEAKASG